MRKFFSRRGVDDGPSSPAVVGATPTLDTSGQAIDSNAIMTALPQKQSECYSTSSRLQQREAPDQDRGALEGRSTYSMPHSSEQNKIADTIWKNNIIPPMVLRFFHNIFSIYS